MAKAIDNPIPKLFKAIGIERVVYVDDRFGVTRERIADRCREMSTEEISASGAFPTLDLTDDDVVREQRLEREINALEESRLARALDQLNQVGGLAAEAGSEDRMVEALSRLLGQAADLKRLSLAQWSAQQLMLVEDAKLIPTLFIFDEDFRLEGWSTHEGRRLIGDLHTITSGYQYAYALLTHNAQNDADERQLESEIGIQNPLLDGFVLVIAKARLSDEQRFVYRLKSTLLFRFFRVVKRKLQEATQSASEEAMKEIDGLDIDAFEHIVFSSSQREGAWSPETLVRIFSVVQERHVRTKLRGDQEVHSLVARIDPMCGLPTGHVAAEIAETARRLQRLEIYDERDVNSLHLPLELGDIFLDSTNKKQYMLLSQPCDLVVRDNGLRKGSRDSRQFFPLASIMKHRNPKGNKPNFPIHEHELPHFEESRDHFYSVCINDILLVPAWLLDLSVLNEPGTCSLQQNQAEPILLTTPWRRRFKELMNRAAAVVRALDTFEATEEESRSELLQSLLRLPLGTPLTVSLSPERRKGGEIWTLNFGLTRITRLRERHSMAVLTHYGSYLTRLAHPHDLTDF